ncbi:MAG: prepilin-type N-terminal cleavage/methylation domain-containing protein [Clostridiales bacterium]|nr:prepilin-type N-terminal cleavage/methylation domain-containing protein [Clostridiales bacterium]
MLLNKIKQNTSGYSLIEIMVSLAIFAILLLSILSIAQSVSNGQKAAIQAQNTQESLRFAFEVISKEMRSAKQSDDKCALSGVDNDNNEVFNIGNFIGDSDVLYFKNKNNECTYYYLEGSRLKIARDDDIITDSNIDNDFFISPNDVNITNLKFNIIDNEIYNVGEYPQDPIQPLVTITIELEGAGAKFKQKFTMQTSVSSRHY